MLLVGRKRLLQGGRGATRADLQLALWPPMATAPQEGMKNMGTLGGARSYAEGGAAGPALCFLVGSGWWQPSSPTPGRGRALSGSRVSSSGHLVMFLLIQRNTFMLSIPYYPNFCQLVNYINYITCAIVCGILNLTRR